MKFKKTKIDGLFIIEIEQLPDERGFFARTFDRALFGRNGLAVDFVQHNISLTHKRGTIRGIHYQATPHEEAKLIRCTKGEVFDVAIDLRPRSSTYKRLFTHTLTHDSYQLLYIPEGVAHGFQTLTDDVEMSYLMSHPFHPDAARGIRWDDPQFRINWPLPLTVASEKDKAIPDWKP